MIEHRLGTHFNNSKISSDFVDAILRHPKSCDTVWFTTEYGFPLLKTHAEKARAAGRAAQIFRENGIGVSLQIANTIGHGEYMKAEDNAAIQEMGLKKLIGGDGIQADYAFCWNGEKLRRYTAETVKLYAAAIRPDVVWIDDDLRPTNHFPVSVGCFCPDCMRAFNRQYNTAFTREELVQAVNMGDVEWRERWISFIRKGIADFAALIVEAVHSVSPSTQMALQFGLADNIAGGDERHIFDVLRSGSHFPASRAGEGTYHDKNPLDLLGKQIFLSYGNARLPQYVRYRVPEIENLPDVVYGKSNYGTVLEGTLGLAYGHTGLSFATVMTPYEDFSFHEELLSQFSRIRKYWEHLIKVNLITFSGCAGIISGGYRRIKDKTCRFGYGKIYGMHGTSLTRLGIAESFETQHAPFLVLLHDVIDTLTDEEIRPLFSQPVLTDAIAIEKLIDRGFKNLLPVTVRPVSSLSYREKLSGGRSWTESFFSCENEQPYVIEGNCVPFGELYDGKCSVSFGISAAQISVGKARWGVLGYSLWDDIVSGAKRDQIIAVADSVCNGLYAYIATHAQVTCVPRVSAEGKVVSVTVINISISPTGNLELIIKNPAGNRAVFENAEEIKELTPRIHGERMIVTLPPFIRGWDAGTVFLS